MVLIFCHKYIYIYIVTMDNVDSGQGSKKEVRVIPVRQKLRLQTVKAVFLKISLLLAPYDIIRS